MVVGCGIMFVVAADVCVGVGYSDGDRLEGECWEFKSLSLSSPPLSFVSLALLHACVKLPTLFSIFFPFHVIPSFFLDFLSITVVFPSLFSSSYCLHILSSNNCG